jgi:hypothetical protein
MRDPNGTFKNSISTIVRKYNASTPNLDYHLRGRYSHTQYISHQTAEREYVSILGHRESFDRLLELIIRPIIT